MPATIKKSVFKYKNQNGQYVNVDMAAERPLAEQIAEIEAAGKEVLESIPSEYTELEGRVDDLEEAVEGKQDQLTFDSVPTENSNNPVKSSGVYNAINSVTIHQPMVGQNGNWFIWDQTNGQYVDSGWASSGPAADAKASSLVAEGYAVGKQNGTDVDSTSPYYENNANYYLGLTRQAKTEAEALLIKEKLLDEMVPDTTQAIAFDQTTGNVQSITHSSNGVAVRTDVYTFGTNTITEVRTLSTGQSLTIVTNTETLATTITYDDGQAA